MLDSAQRWPRWLIWVITIVILAVVIGLVIEGYQYPWTGFGEATHAGGLNEEYTSPKTLWDWLGLLLIPLLLAGGGLWFSWAERKSEQAIAERRAETDRKIADGLAQEAALQAYLEQMSTLLIDKGLRSSTQGEDEAKDHFEDKDRQAQAVAQVVARSWTLTILRRVKGERKGLLLRFLYESGLIMDENTILQTANLEGAILKGVYLAFANLALVNLERANLERANLTGAILIRASLESANLEQAYLVQAYLVRVNLAQANLTGANLLEALYDNSTTWPDGFTPPDTALNWDRLSEEQRDELRKDRWYMWLARNRAA